MVAGHLVLFGDRAPERYFGSTARIGEWAAGSKRTA